MRVRGASEGKKFDGLGAEVPSGECENLLESEHETAAAKSAFVSAFVSDRL
jgi:hypothetical protein